MIISVTEIARRLSEHTEALSRRFLPAGNSRAGEWVCGSVTGESGQSLKVTLSGTHAGEWRDWATDDRGDMLDLWRLAKNITQAEAIKEAKAFLGISDSVFKQEVRKYDRPKGTGTAELNPAGAAMTFLVEKRKLEPSTVNRFKVVGSPEQRAIAFPCYSPAGELINHSYRTLPAAGENKKVWQDKGCAPSMFGWQAISERAYRDRTIILCEGQIDAMTWNQWGFDALSIPNGSGQTWIEYEWDNLLAFDNLLICFDMDGAGRENAHKAIARLGVHRCMIVRLPCKDANDCLMGGYTESDAAGWVQAAEPPKLSGLVRSSEMERRILAELEPKPAYFTLPFFQMKDPDEGFAPRPGDVTLWTGITGHGKSTILNAFALAYIMKGTPVFIASMEMKPEKLIVRMLRSAFGTATGEHVSVFLKECGHELIFADVMGYIQQDRLLEMMRFSFQRYGVSQCIIDSLMRVDGLEEDYPAQGKFMNDIQEFSKSTGCHVHLVAHPRKVREDARLGKLDIKGSSLIPNNADNIISVFRNVEKDRLRKAETLTKDQDYAMHDTEVCVEKQRETGWEGAIKLKFNRKNFVFSAMEK